jgi:hypothetical protein
VPALASKAHFQPYCVILNIDFIVTNITITITIIITIIGSMYNKLEQTMIGRYERPKQSVTGSDSCNGCIIINLFNNINS